MSAARKRIEEDTFYPEIIMVVIVWMIILTIAAGVNISVTYKADQRTFGYEETCIESHEEERQTCVIVGVEKLFNNYQSCLSYGGPTHGHGCSCNNPINVTVCTRYALTREAKE